MHNTGLQQHKERHGLQDYHNSLQFSIIFKKHKFWQKTIYIQYTSLRNSSAKTIGILTRNLNAYR